MQNITYFTLLTLFIYIYYLNISFFFRKITIKQNNNFIEKGEKPFSCIIRIN